MTIHDSVNGIPVTINVPGDLSDDQYAVLMNEIDSIVEMFINSYSSDGDGFTVETLSFWLNDAGTKLNADCFAVNKDTGETSSGDVTIDVQIKISKE